MKMHEIAEAMAMEQLRQTDTLLKQKLEAYITKRAVYDLARKVSNEAEEARRHAEYELVNAMLDAKMKALTTDDGMKFSLKRRFTFSVTKANTQAIRDWLMEEEGDDTDYVSEGINKEALGELLARKVETDGVAEEDLPAFLKATSMPTVSVLGWKNRNSETENER